MAGHDEMREALRKAAKEGDAATVRQLVEGGGAAAAMGEWT